MTMTTQYLAFGVGTSPNTYSYSTYAASAQLGPGYSAGTADAQHVNTVLRQVSVAVAALAKLAADYGTQNMLDDGSVANFEIGLKSALDALYIPNLSGYVPFTGFTGGNQSLGTNGWQKLPGGLILQWGTYTTDITIPTSGAMTPIVITLPITFPNACLNVQLSTRNPSNDVTADSWPELISQSASSFSMVGQNTGNSGTTYKLHGFTWFAIGW